MNSRQQSTRAIARRRRAIQIRDMLIEQLGNECINCGSYLNLEFDCIKPCGDKHHRMRPDDRMRFYLRQHFASNLQLLCSDCNNKKSRIESSAHYLNTKHRKKKGQRK